MLESLIPWVIVDLEINPETDELAKGAILSVGRNSRPVSRTYNGIEEGTLFSELHKLLTPDSILIGHNLRRHDLRWLLKKAPEIANHPSCIDTLELFPIFFPFINSYALEKTYQDPRIDPLIGKKRRNHPALDCEATGKLLDSIIVQSKNIEDPAYLIVLGALLVHGGAFANGYARLFPSECRELDPLKTFGKFVEGRVCSSALAGLESEGIDEAKARSLAYVLSVLPMQPGRKPIPLRPWVRHSHQDAQTLIRKLRDVDCKQCDYCRDQFDLLTKMRDFFNFENPSWRSTGQQEITEAVMDGKDVIGVLPTSGGKSLTFQLPAFIKAETTGELTVVLSPLRSLMDDQVDKLVQAGRDDVCQISGKLNSLEKSRNLRSIKAVKAASGGSEVLPQATHLVYMAPEQLRSQSVLRALASRGIGLLVIDEAHCIAKWGKDFRVDYRFIPNILHRFCEQNSLPIPQILCLTATARREVLAEISDCFKRGLNISLQPFDRGHAREKLDFKCIEFEEGSESKFLKLKECLETVAVSGEPTLIFCSTQNRTEEICRKLMKEGFQSVDYYHGACPNEHRQNVQDRFLQGDLQIVVATNAFGMGVDKKDIRQVIHYDIPGSIENYVQEAGRAGRDGLDAKCILFYDPLDIDTQLDLRRRNNLRKQELKRIVITIKHRYSQMKRWNDGEENILISARDLLRTKLSKAEIAEFSEDGTPDETEAASMAIDEEERNDFQKVVTALGILEEGKHLERLENIYNPISVPFRINNWDRIEALIQSSSLPDNLKAILRRAAEYLFERYSSRESENPLDLEILADHLYINREEVEDRIKDLRGIGICNRGVEYVIEWRRHGHDSSMTMLKNQLQLLRFQVERIEGTEISFSSSEEPIDLHDIRNQSAVVEGGGYYSNLSVSRDIKLLATWGMWTIEKRRRGFIDVKWVGGLDRIEEKLRQLEEVTELLLRFLGKEPEQKHHVTDKFNFESFTKWDSSRQELFKIKISEEDCEEALLYMHYRQIIKVVDGFSLLRARMKLRPSPERIDEDYMSAYKDYESYTKTTIGQVKAMEAYAGKLAKNGEHAKLYLNDYFIKDWEDFTRKYFAERELKNLALPIRTKHFDEVFGLLSHEQMAAVKTKTNGNHIVIAGPGSGKTYLLVRRIFYLVKVRQVPAWSIAVLAYNRHATIEIRKRLKELLPKDWRDISVYTFHGLALRLVGRDRLYELQADQKEKTDTGNNGVFEQLLIELKEGLEAHQGNETHEQLKWLDRLGGIEYLLVDEFQDIGSLEYQIITLLSRINSGSKENAVQVMVVGDEDQSIYEFRERLRAEQKALSGQDGDDNQDSDGQLESSIQWIQNFQHDFKINEPIIPPHNFRSIPSIINVASKFISQNETRLKAKDWVQLIPPCRESWVEEQVTKDFDHGKVVRLRVSDKAVARVAIAQEIQSIQASWPELKLGEICIAHHTNSEVYLTKLLLEARGYNSIVLGEHRFGPKYNLGIIELIQELNELDPDNSTISYSALESRLNKLFKDRKIDPSWLKTWESFFDPAMLDVSVDYEMSLKQMLWRIDEYFIGRSGVKIPPDAISNLTLHGTKGLEFHTVFLFPPVFEDSKGSGGVEGLRRLYFVGLSRAKVKLYLVDWAGCDTSIWDEISTVAGDWIVTRGPADCSTCDASSDEVDLASNFRYFDTNKEKLGTGMDTYFVADQGTITSLVDGETMTLRTYITEANVTGLELIARGMRVGRIKAEAVSKLRKKVRDRWDRIFRIEVAQIMQTETKEDRRSYNGGKMHHYFVVPRIFYR